MQKQTGFTLIELIMVIVILGILAATALPKFVDLSGEATRAKAEGVAGAVAGSASITKAAALVGASGVTYDVGTACSGSYLDGGAMPAGCTGSGTTSCTVVCDGVSAPAVTLPANI